MIQKKRSKLVPGGQPQINVLRRCYDCGLPRIDSTCPPCGQVQRFSYIRIAKPDAGGHSQLARELSAVLAWVQRELAKVQITQSGHAGPIDQSHRGHISSARNPGDRTSPSRTESDVDLRASITAVLSELTACGRQLADAKARDVGRIEGGNRQGATIGTSTLQIRHRFRRIQLKGRRLPGLCAGCGKPAIIARDRMCDACLLARGYRRCPDCGVPCKPGSFGARGICSKCLKRGRLKRVSVKTVSGGLPTLVRRR